MFGHKHYVPILKGKRGDVWALRHLKNASRALITPLIEPVPPNPKQTEEGQMQKLIKQLCQGWPAARFFVDLLWRELAPAVAGQHVVEYFFDLARQNNLEAIPVTATGRNPAYQQSIRHVVQTDNRGLAIRLGLEDFEVPGQVQQALNTLLGIMRLARNQVDLIVDLRSVFTVPQPTIAQVSISEINQLPNIADWRTLIVAAGSFPPNLSHLPQQAWSHIPRKEWISWRAVIGGNNPPARLPSYGDYTVGDPELPYSGPAPYAANLRYSVDTDFFVWRGYPCRSHPLGNGQMHLICQDLIGRQQYAGAQFSQGDAEIHQRATNLGSPGGPTEWRQWATNHYLELVGNQISNLP